MSTTDVQPDRVSDDKNWTRIGWFGVVAGSTVWMLCTGIYLAAEYQWFAVFPLASALATVVTGAIVWRSRHRISINRGMMESPKGSGVFLKKLFLV